MKALLILIGFLIRTPTKGNVKVEFALPMPPNTPEVKVPMPNESSISDYCIFAQAVLSMPPMEGFDAEF